MKRLVIMVASVVLIGLIGIVADGLRDEVQASDVGVVLGSKVMPDGTPSDRLRARLCVDDVLAADEVADRCGRIEGGRGHGGLLGLRSMRMTQSRHSAAARLGRRAGITVRLGEQCAIANPEQPWTHARSNPSGRTCTASSRWN